MQSKPKTSNKPKKPKRRTLSGQGADIFFGTEDRETGEPSNGETGEPSDGENILPGDDEVVKTSFYPTQNQLDKLDDLATEYNKKYRRQRKKIDRQDIIRFLIDHCTLDSLNDLTL